MTHQEIEQKAEEMSQVVFEMSLTDRERDERMTAILDEVVTDGTSFILFLDLVETYLEKGC